MGKICQEQAKLHDLQEEAKKREEQIISDLEAVSASMYWNLALWGTRSKSMCFVQAKVKRTLQAKDIARCWRVPFSIQLCGRLWKHVLSMPCWGRTAGRDNCRASEALCSFRQQGSGRIAWLQTPKGTLTYTDRFRSSTTFWKGRTIFFYQIHRHHWTFASAVFLLSLGLKATWGVTWWTCPGNSPKDWRDRCMHLREFRVTPATVFGGITNCEVMEDFMPTHRFCNHRASLSQNKTVVDCGWVRFRLNSNSEQVSCGTALTLVMLDFTLVLWGSSALKRFKCSCPCPRIQKSLQHCVDSLGQAIFNYTLCIPFFLPKHATPHLFQTTLRSIKDQTRIKLEHIIESIIVFDSLLWLWASQGSETP